MTKKLKGGAFGIFQHPFCRKISKNLRDIKKISKNQKLRKKVSQSRKYSKGVSFGRVEFLRCCKNTTP